MKTEMIEAPHSAVVVRSPLSPGVRRALRDVGAVVADDGSAVVIAGDFDAVQRALGVIAHSDDAPPPFVLEDRPGNGGATIIDGLQRAVDAGIVSERRIEEAAFAAVDHPIIRALQSAGVWTALRAVDAAVQRLASAMDDRARANLMHEWRVAMTTIAARAAPVGYEAEGGSFCIPVRWRFVGRIATPLSSQRATASAQDRAANVLRIAESVFLGEQFVVVHPARRRLIERFERVAVALQTSLTEMEPRDDGRLNVACYAFRTSDFESVVDALAEAVADVADAPRIFVGTLERLEARNGVVEAEMDDEQAQDVINAWDEAARSGMLWVAPGAQHWMSHFILNRGMLGDICCDIAPQRRRAVAVAALQAMYGASDVGFSLTTEDGVEIVGEALNEEIWHGPCVEAVKRILCKRMEST